MKQYKLYLGDNMASLKKLPDNSIDSVVTDPPYGLNFMGKKWDYDVPSVEFWKEVYRVLKPGGHILSFGGTRTYHRMVVNIEDAGFEIRDQIMWIYGSGFPKSHNIGKAVDKIQGNKREVIGTKNDFALDGRVRNTDIHKPLKETINADHTYGYKEGWDTPVTKGNSAFEGYGTALKPANEPICVARKPLSEKTVAANMMKWGTGGINVDGCRIGSEVHKVIGTNISGKIGEDQFDRIGDDRNYEGMNKEVEGRFPANIIFECTCEEVIKGEKGEVKKTNRVRNNDTGVVMPMLNNNADKTEMIDNYNDTGDIHTDPNCPCYQLDQQSGVSKANGIFKKRNKLNNHNGNSIFNTNEIGSENYDYNDKGGASRFFYVAKVSKKERNMGLEGFEEKTDGAKGNGLDRRCSHCNTSQLKPNDCKCETPNWITPAKKNHHPTVKPINLMTYLIRLVTPENGIVLEPFMGSGSTGIAAILEGRRFVGMEMDEEYFKIAEKRIESWEQYKKIQK
jgi:site-specific DNA-methyltransferase (adenine-specific)